MQCLQEENIFPLVEVCNKMQMNTDFFGSVIIQESFETKIKLVKKQPEGTPRKKKS